MNCDIEIHWHISHFCNYKCSYCFCGRIQKTAFRGIQDIKKILAGFDRLEKKCLINISGGEPFLYPNFVSLCQDITKKHMLSVNTNLSSKEVIHFAESIDPEKVKYLNCSLNIEDREHLNLIDDYIEKYKLLQKNGFYVLATYVMYPPFIKRFEKDYHFYKSHGIILRPKIFRGQYEFFSIPDVRFIRRLKRFFTHVYPDGYSKNEKEKIISYISQSQKENEHADKKIENNQARILDVGLDSHFIEGLPSFKNKICLAGKNFFRVTPKGEAYRCHSGEHHLGNLFEGTVQLFQEPQKCPYEVCLCPYLGYKYVAENKCP